MLHILGVGLEGVGHRREHGVKEHIDHRARNNRRANIDGIIINDGSGTHKSGVKFRPEIMVFCDVIRNFRAVELNTFSSSL
jgi:hypothetical protein